MKGTLGGCPEGVDVERQPVFSPDGRWVAYNSDSSAREEVYIRPFPRGETVHQVSRSGGWAPRWRHDGKELFFVREGDAMVMALSADPATGGAVGVPCELFRTEFSHSSHTRWTAAKTLVYIQCRYMGTTTQVSKWGNSLGLRLPKSVAREAQLDVGDTVDVSVDNGAIVIRPNRPRYSLKELVRRITPKNRHDESEWGGPVGDEVW